MFANRKNTFITLSLMSVSLFLSLATLQAAPALGGIYELGNPDGKTVKVRIWGDEFYQVVESLDGHTLVRDPVTNFICYAQLSEDGDELLSTGVEVKATKRAPSGLTKHIRINSDSANKKIKVAQEKFYSICRGSRATRGRFTIKQISGNIKGVCILVDFPDEQGTIPAADVDNYCNQKGYSGNGNNGSIRDYFYDVSSGKVEYTNYVTPNYYTAKNNKTYYDNGGDAGQQAKALVLEMLQTLDDNGLDFSQYDSDNDGYIDAINLFYTGACKSGWAKGLWPHCMPTGWNYFEADGVKSDCYQITPMVGQAGQSLNIGTFCHENGHMLAKFPDLYCYEQNNPNRGVGKLCLMCEGGHGTNPAWPSAYLRYKTGWTTVTELDQNTNQSCTIKAFSNEIFRYANPNDAKEYFLIENRQQSNRDAHLPCSGLAIFLVDENGSNEYPTSNDYAGHNESSAMQADGKKDLENGVNTSDDTDLWSTQTQTSFDANTTPSSNWWNGNASGFSLANISASAETMTFDVGTGGTATTPSIASDTTSLTVKCATGADAASEEIKIWNKGVGSLSFSVASDVTWMACTPTSGTSTGTTEKTSLTVAFTTSALAAGTYTGKITITDANANNSPLTISVNLTIGDTGGGASSITLTSPVGGETWSLGATHQITWTSTNVSTVVVQIYKGGELYAQTSSFSDTGSYAWTISSDFEAGTDYQALVYNNDDSSVKDNGNYFTIASASSSGALTLTSPNGGETWKSGETRTITWTSSGVAGTVSVEVYKGTYLVAYGYNLENTGGAYWTIDDAEGGTQYMVYVYSDTDPYNVYDTNDSYFTVTGSSGGAAGTFNVSMGYTFSIDADDVPDMQGDASTFTKKPKVYAKDGKKSLKAKVLTKTYPAETISCVWKKKYSAGQYTLYCVPKGYGENTISEDFNLMNPDIDASNSSWSASNEKITSKGTFYDITVNLSGKYFGLKKPKVKYVYIDPVKGKTKKKNFKVTSYGDDNMDTGACTLTAIGKKIPYSASGSIYLINKIGEDSVTMEIKSAKSSPIQFGGFKPNVNKVRNLSSPANQGKMIGLVPRKEKPILVPSI